MSAVIRSQMRWILPILASISTILLVGCAGDDGFSIPFIAASYKTSIWRVVVTGVDPVTASKIGAAAGQQLLLHNIASSFVTDAAPADHILEIRITGAHFDRRLRRATDSTTLPPATLDRLESRETVWNDMNAALTIEQRFEISITETIILANPNQGAVTLLADQIGDLLSHTQPRLG